MTNKSTEENNNLRDRPKHIWIQIFTKVALQSNEEMDFSINSAELDFLFFQELHIHMKKKVDSLLYIIHKTNSRSRIQMEAYEKIILIWEISYKKH